MLKCIYGWPDLEPGSSLIQHLHALTARITNAVLPGSFLVDSIPILKYLPSWIASWKRDGQEWHRQETAMLEGFNADVAAQMVCAEFLTPLTKS
jgi:hypothetical protein